MMNRLQALKISRRAWVANLCSLPVFILSIAQAHAGEQKMTYEVYAGGIHAVQAQLIINTSDPEHYDIVMTAKTRGFLGSVAPWEGTFESHGWTLQGPEFRPQQHKSTAIWRGESEISEYLYTKDRRFLGLTITEDGKKPDTREVAAELTEATTDAFTAALQVMQAVGEGQACEGSSEIFDGKRRFRQVFADNGTAELTESKYNIFRGKASECTVEVIPVAGKWHEKPRGWLSIQEQGRALGTMPTVWMAKLDQDGPAVPVKIRVKTDYGTLFMHLAQYEGGGRSVSAQKRAAP
jgi:hypothetical protein